MGLESSKESDIPDSEDDGLESNVQRSSVRMREINRMDTSVRSKFARGVQYNMRILIRGSNRTGKSLLWKRFQRMPYSDEYESTAEIQVATMDWSPPSCSGVDGGDVVKVEIWDVVDKAKHTQQNSANRISTADLKYNLKEDVPVPEGKHTLKLLDASTLDVYQGAQAVIFMINPFDRQSLQYVLDQYPSVPGTVSILLVLGRRDQLPVDRKGDGAEVAVTMAQVQEACQQMRAYRSNLATDDVTAIEASLKDGYGLLHLHNYFDVPFLRLKQLALQNQLARVEAQLQSTQEQIERAVASSTYQDFLRNRGFPAGSVAPTAPSSVDRGDGAGDSSSPAGVSGAEAPSSAGSSGRSSSGASAGTGSAGSESSPSPASASMIAHPSSTEAPTSSGSSSSSSSTSRASATSSSSTSATISLSAGGNRSASLQYQERPQKERELSQDIPLPPPSAPAPTSAGADLALKPHTAPQAGPQVRHKLVKSVGDRDPGDGSGRNNGMESHSTSSSDREWARDSEGSEGAHSDEAERGREKTSDRRKDSRMAHKVRFGERGLTSVAAVSGTRRPPALRKATRRVTPEQQDGKGEGQTGPPGDAATGGGES